MNETLKEKIFEALLTGLISVTTYLFFITEYRKELLVNVCKNYDNETKNYSGI